MYYILSSTRQIKHPTANQTQSLRFQKSKSYNTRYSQVVTDPSTKRANIWLTAEIRRDPVKQMCMVVAEKKIFGLLDSC
jgi:hypothetical protein